MSAPPAAAPPERLGTAEAERLCPGGGGSRYARESIFLVAHPADPGAASDVVVVSLARRPAQGVFEGLHMGRYRGRPYLRRHHERLGAADAGGGLAAGPLRVDVHEPGTALRYRCPAGVTAPAVDLTFRARTGAQLLPAGFLVDGPETIWHQRQLVQSGTVTGTVGGEAVEGWLGQRDHSFGLRAHHRMPRWIWLAVHLPDATLALWVVDDLASTARRRRIAYTAGCLAGPDRAVPVAAARVSCPVRPAPARGFAVGLELRAAVRLADGQSLTVTGRGRFAAGYGPRGGGLAALTATVCVGGSQPRPCAAAVEVTGRLVAAARPS